MLPVAGGARPGPGRMRMGGGQRRDTGRYRADRAADPNPVHPAGRRPPTAAGAHPGRAHLQRQRVEPVHPVPPQTSTPFSAAQPTVALSPDGPILATGGYDGTARLYGVSPTGNLRREGCAITGTPLDAQPAARSWPIRAISEHLQLTQRTGRATHQVSPARAETLLKSKDT